MKDLLITNFCIPGMMSHCTAGNKWENQRDCRYARKATVANRCMYFRESLGGHCDCVEAQKDIRSI
jgi:hypothetical protein